LTLRLKLSGASALAALVLLLAGCGGDDDDEGSSPARDEVKVGLITDQGQLNDRGFNELAFKGLKRAERELGIEGRVIESATEADYVPNITSLVRQDFDLIVGVGFAQGPAFDTAAGKFGDTKFVIIDVDQSTLPHKPSNVVGLLFREEQAGYLAGYLAGLVEKRSPGKDVLGSVGGMKEPPVDRFIAGYQAGARKAAPGATVLNGYSQDWEDVARCKELALNQIARGARVVFQVAGGCGLGALDAAKERGMWGIGVDADQSFLGPHVMTSALKRVDQAVFQTIESVQDGSWRGGRNLTFGLAEKGVGLGTFSPRVNAADRKAVDQVAKEIAAGRVEIPREVG
jgi:basic membrane protein A and related proteins